MWIKKKTSALKYSDVLAVRNHGLRVLHFPKEREFGLQCSLGSLALSGQWHLFAMDRTEDKGPSKF